MLADTTLHRTGASVRGLFDSFRSCCEKKSDQVRADKSSDAPHKVSCEPEYALDKRIYHVRQAWRLKWLSPFPLPLPASVRQKCPYSALDERPRRASNAPVRRAPVHLFKMLLLFAVVTSASVYFALLLHGTHSRSASAAPRVDAASVLPVAASAMRPAALTTRPPSVFGEGFDVRPAIPVETVEAKPVPVAPPVQVASLSITARDIADLFPQRPPTPDTSEALVALPLPPIYQAVLTQDEDWLMEALKSGLSPDVVTVAGDTALCAAVQGGFVKGVELLLLHGADVTKVGRDGQPPLALAALRRNEPVLEALLRGGADPNTTFQTPVDKELLDSVKQPSLQFSLRSDSGLTALMACAARGDVESTILLLQHGAKTSLHTKKYSRYAINFAADQHFLFVMRILLGRPADAEPDILVTIDLSKQKAWIAEHGQIIDTTSVSTGRQGYGTPSGRYVVTDKHKSWTSTLYHVSMPFFMRLNCSAIGLHSGHVTGRPASHGCIRLPYDKAKKWFGIVKVGDEVQIVH